MATNSTHTTRDAAPPTTTTTTDDDDEDTSPGPTRHNAARVILPGRIDSETQLEVFLPLEDVFADALAKSTPLDTLEFLTMPGDNPDDEAGVAQQEHYLCAHDTSRTDADTNTDAIKATDPDQSTFDAPDIPDEDANTATKTATNAITNPLEEHCPEIDYQVGNLDLSPLADLPVPTSRLLVYADHSIDSTEGAEFLRAIKLLNELITQNIPHIYQLLIQRGSNQSDAEYTATVRLAVFDEEYGVATDDDLDAHLASPYQYCISTYFRDQNTTSNFDLPIRRFTNVRDNANSTRYRINGRPIYLRNHPFPIEELATFREYNNLLAASFTADERYKRHFNCYARIPLHGDAVHHLAGIIPAYYKYSPWERTAVTDCPSFSTTHIPTTSSTPQRLGTTTVNADHPTDTTQSESKPHRALVNAIINFLVQQGYTILAVDQDTIDADLTNPDPTTQPYFPGDSQPDIIAEKNDTITGFEAEINDSNPAAYLKNLERASHYDYRVVVVTEDNNLCSNKLNIASQPYRDSTARGVILYTLSDSLTTEDGDITYLLPQDASAALWYLTGDQLTLSLDDHPDVSCHAETPLHELTYPTPRYRKQGGEYVVTDATGEHIATYPTIKALHKEFSELKAPFIPTQTTYLDHIEIRYHDDTANQLKRYYKQPMWAREHMTKSGKRTKAARDTFINSHTRQADSESLFIPAVREEFYAWYDHQTDLDTAGDSWFARDLDNQFDASDTDSRDRKLLNRTWHYTPGLTPPLPSFPDPDDTTTHD
ncbi:hypothetical protein [Halobacterium salinarum]|uniref:hypothetical protein n=1 Tax=Halobacterium salinarum TaxID=2242 RepID=UPI0025557C47|nr:hypothetical protein [Halobacterium salinarum]MDL0126538.1 hypothetical protein [Halobacterium salinarum]